MASDEFDMRLRLEAERRRRASAQPETPPKEDAPAPNAAQAFRSSFGTNLMNGMMAIPSAAGDLLAGGAAAVEGLSAPLAGEEMAFGRRFQEQQQRLPASLIRAIPRPQVQDIAAGFRSLSSFLPGGESPGAAFARNRDAIAADEEAMRSAHPIASIAGDVTADITSLAMGKAPLAGAIRRGEQRLLPHGADMYFGKAAASAVQPGIRRTLERALSAEAPRLLARGARRSLESGLEAAVLEVMNDKEADPIEAAALAAGGQAVGSAVLEGGKGILSGGMLKAGGKVAITAASIGAMWQLLKASTPGGRDSVLESIQTGFDKVAFSVMLGGVAAAAGAPRYRDSKLSEEIPSLVEALSSVPRGATLSLLTRYAKADPAEQQRFGDVLDRLSHDPAYAGSTPEEQAIIRTIKDASPTKVSGVIDRSSMLGVLAKQSIAKGAQPQP